MLSPNMPLTQTAYRQNRVCSHYLRAKVAVLIAIRDAKHMLNLLLQFIAGCATVCLLLFSGASHAAENMPQKQAAMPIDLIELLGELGDDEADLEVAMSNVESNRAEKKHAENKPTMTENSNKGAEK
jgi:hypothetical protein